MIDGVAHTQARLFRGEDLRPPFPATPIHPVSNEQGLLTTQGTVFSQPEPEPAGTQSSLFISEPQAVPSPSAPIESEQPAPGAASAEQEQQNPLFAILREDEISVDPNEVTIEEAEANGYPLLRRDVVTYRWWLEVPFDTREQPELYQALKAAKWHWGGYRQQWFNPSHFPILPDHMLYAFAGPAYYAEENAQRLEARATRAWEQSNQHGERSDQLASVIPFGQPMMPGHHSYRSDLSYRKKIWRQTDLFVAFYKKAEWLENRAEGSRRLQRSRGSISAMQNRLDRLQADLRSFRRGYQEGLEKGAGEEELNYYRRHMTILANEIIPLQAGIAERGGLPIDKIEQERPLQPGDYILIHGHARFVVKVNQKTIKVADPQVHDATGNMWELTYKKSDFQKVLATKEELEERRK